jgi:penicillin-binding protein 1B
MARLRRWTGVGLFVAGLVGSLGVLWLDGRVRAYLAGPPLGTTRIFSSPTVLRPGGAVPGGALPRKLARLGYHAATGGVPAPGEYRVQGAVVEVTQRPSPAPWAPAPRRAQVVVRNGIVAELTEVGGAKLERLDLEPEVLAVLGARGPALDAGDPAPPVCRGAVLAAEDRHFFRHPGLDPIAIVRALWTNLRAGDRRQGGSTITQQLVKNAFLSPHRTIRRKLEEAVLAVILEIRATKEQILRRYLASVYLGTDGGLPVHGFAQAAEVYFAKPLGQLGAAECALLAGIIRAPNGLAPRTHPRAARVRRDQVLGLMVEEGLLPASAAAAARTAPVALAPPRGRPVAALYVAAEVARELRRLLPSDLASAPGLAVFTGIDPDMQRDAERAVRRQVTALERGRRRRQPLQAALVALDPHGGQVRALVGGRDYGSSPLDRAVRARRQPGSAFKPFVYLAALDPARRRDADARTVVSAVDDEPIALRIPGGSWQPANYDGTFAGRIPLEDALAESRNAATVRLALDVGLEAVARAATDLGVAGPLPRVPALSLGAAETSLLELTAAYGVFASGGLRRLPRLVVGVVSPVGETIYAAPPDERRVLGPGVAYLMTHLLERVVDSGTAASARRAGLRGPAAGKTGTTDDTRDAWFIGYTPEVVAGVWVGLDGGGPTGLTGASGALPIWTEFVRATARDTTTRAFPVPEDVVWREVDPASGLLATGGCPETRRAPFLAGTEPRATCDRHRAVWTAVGEGVAGTVREGAGAVGAGGRRLGGWLGRLFR